MTASARSASSCAPLVRASTSTRSEHRSPRARRSERLVTQPETERARSAFASSPLPGHRVGPRQPGSPSTNDLEVAAAVAATGAASCRLLFLRLLGDESLGGE